MTIHGVDDNTRIPVLLGSRDRIDDQIGTDLGRIIYPNIKTGPDACSYNERVTVRDLFHCQPEDLRERRNDRGDDCPLHILSLNAVQFQDRLQKDRVFKLCLRPVRRDSLRKVDLLIVETPDFNVGISHIYCKNHFSHAFRSFR